MLLLVLLVGRSAHPSPSSQPYTDACTAPDVGFAAPPMRGPRGPDHESSELGELRDLLGELRDQLGELKLGELWRTHTR